MQVAKDKYSIITRRRLDSQPEWKQELSAAITDPAELLRIVGLDDAWLPAARRAAARFGLLAPRRFVARIRRADPSDPLLRQILPLAEETMEVPGYGPDPVGDRAAEVSPGVLTKYHGRALLVASGGCAINCRYCFRREFPYSGHIATMGQWREAVAAIAADPTISEVILSGGDPLMLPDDRLHALTRALEDVGHVRRIRIHSRMPVVLPERVDDGLCEWIAGSRWPIVTVVHVNHPVEIGKRAAAAFGRLRGAGSVLMNQSVLLRGVNDDVDTLVSLSEALFDAGAIPYYLHFPDPVTGTAHFSVSEDRARTLALDMARRLPGYLVPRLVMEVDGDLFKRPIGIASHFCDAEAERNGHPL
jgi:EF-P beta-lysylation protein EpmB